MAERILNITNGDCAVEVLTRAGQPGDWLPWRDILHEGPVPDGLDLTGLSVLRARFISERGWAPLEQADFEVRDAWLAQCGEYDRIRLWFEHDLYDQLQLLQILDWLAAHPPSVPVTLLTLDDYLGTASPELVERYLEAERPVSAAQLGLAQVAWAAFRADTPERWAGLLDADTGALPFFDGAVRRLLEEYPQPHTGLSRTAYHALSLIGQGEDTFGPLFGEVQNTEERRFMGDLGFRWLLHNLSDGEEPLLVTDSELPAWQVDPAQRFQLTAKGRLVLAGQASAGDLMIRNRWIGGVHLRPDRFWEWDAATGRLQASTLRPAPVS
ncbi:hypothetical protein EZI54_19205 [Marinobacter halodurans]|uniref:DUF1835 domain-containing protein n=1 Tax=Marinobacter halodurans TaxID=2528979 RepID=A0ABY1ZFP9_9GAMM|nr:hypothetical protein [Marinobacter halodurans]TBW49841.1 hypothetical protein EZI54_19205 [Marinobacter halodurans]